MADSTTQEQGPESALYCKTVPTTDLELTPQRLRDPCIGTELLLGNILNGNARWLAESLASLGIPHFRQGVVGDNPERLREAVLEQLAAAGTDLHRWLGPTPDDLTTETLAACFGVPLEERPEVLADLEAKLRARPQLGGQQPQTGTTAAGG